MPPTYRTPGVYAAETSEDLRSIEASPTAITAFIGPTLQGPLNQPFHIECWSSFENVFGGLSRTLPLGHAVSQFFANGGTDALVMRIGTAEGVATESDILGALTTLEQGERFNLLCIPPLTFDIDLSADVHQAAALFGGRQRALYIANAPLGWTTPQGVTEGLASLFPRSDSAALFFPRLVAPDPINDGAQTILPPCGAVAGVIARCDIEQGVWQAPAGLSASLRGVARPSVVLTDADNGLLNQHGVNALRAFPTHGPVVWGARTLAGADGLSSDWKYIPVRRLAWHLENSIEASLQWTVFEPNAPALWSAIRQEVTAFMSANWRLGALAGATPEQAFFVKCSLGQTMTHEDLLAHLAILEVGFAPLKPAEFIILKLSLKTAPAESTAVL